MSEATAVVTERRRIPAIWLLPVVAVLLGAYMVYYQLSSEGPRVSIRFETAEGITAGKTEIKSRNVQLGIVEEVTLDPGRESVTVTALLSPGAETLLHEDTRFWVVRARIALGSVSGLSTLLSGGYIELDPGEGALGERDFVGLEEPPVTDPSTPGMHLTLVSERAGSVSPGDPVLHRGYQVGRIESAAFDAEAGRMRYDFFVEAPYDRLVGSNTRFWNASGLDVSADATGLNIRTASLEALLGGGVEFETPGDNGIGVAAEPGREFVLYPHYEAALENAFEAYLEYVVIADQSVKGLLPGAPVEFRGTPVGHVVRIMLDEYVLSPESRGETGIPILVRLEPGRLRMSDDEAGKARLREAVGNAVDSGLHAVLQLGNLLTGQLVLSLDFFPTETPGSVGEYEGRPTLPSLSNGIAQIQQQISDILGQVQRMDLARIGASTDTALQDFSATMVTLEATLARIEEVLERESVDRIPDEIAATLVDVRRALDTYSEGSPMYQRIDETLLEMTRTLESLERLARSVEDQPNSLLFRIQRQPDPVPGSGGEP